MRISDWSSDVCSSDLLDYCQRLRAELEARSPGRPAVLAGDPAWLIVEKILAEDEVLAHDWQMDGTSGYDFMNQVGAVLHDAQAQAALTREWTDIVGDESSVRSEERRVGKEWVST